MGTMIEIIYSFGLRVEALGFRVYEGLGLRL